MMVAVEGMDGAGKTTVCNYVSKKYNFQIMERPTKYFFENDNQQIDLDRYVSYLKKIYSSDKFIRSIFFGFGNMVAINKAKNEDTVLDRHIVSNYFWNGDEAYISFYSELIEIIGKPTLTILLHASPDTRFKRIFERDGEDIDLLDKDVFIDGTSKMIWFLEKFDFSYVYIDTDKMTKEEVFEKVDRIIAGLKLGSEKSV